MTQDNLRHSSLQAEHEKLGAKLVDFGGWEMPIAYPTGTISEHLACRNDAVVFDVSHLGTVRLEGDDALGILQGAFTNDLSKIGPGKAQYTHLLDAEGSVLDDIIVWWVSEDRFDVMPNASNTSGVRNAIGGADVTEQRAIIAVQGPNARAVVAKVFPAAAKVPRFEVQKLQWRGAEVVVAGTGYTGEDGIELAVPVALSEDFWRAVVDAGAMPAGLGARDTLRLEAGLPLHGHELGKGITPLQAGLSWVVSWDKGDFIGRDALVQEKEAGVARRLRGIACEGRQPPRAKSAVFIDDSVVGEVTSGNFSPVLGHGIALAFLDPSVAIGADVEIEIRGKRLKGQTVKIPFVQKKG